MQSRAYGRKFERRKAEGVLGVRCWVLVKTKT